VKEDLELKNLRRISSLIYMNINIRELLAINHLIKKKLKEE
jgi:hypothetical protein